MSFSMPKEVDLLKPFNRTKFNELMPILFNEVNLDTAFTLFFEKCIRKGHVAKKLSTKDFLAGVFNFHESLVPKLSANQNLENFDSELGQSILSNWLQASIVEFVPLRRDKSILIPDLLKLLTVATYRARLPRSNNSSSARGIDGTVYGVLIDHLRKLGSSKPEADIQASLMKTSISKGIDFEEYDVPWKEPKYNGRDILDITTMLELRLLEHFPETESKYVAEEMELKLAEPLSKLAQDFLDITNAFGEISSDDLLAMYKSVFCLRLYQLPIHLAIVLSLVRSGDDQAFDYSHKMFVDFSGKRGSVSFDMGQKSAMNDLQTASSLINNIVFLLTAKTFQSSKSTGRTRNSVSKYLTFEDVQNLLTFASSDVASITASSYLDIIEDHFKSLEDKSALAFIDEIVSQSNSKFEAFVSLIVADLGRRSRDGYRKWFKNVGGVELARGTDTVALLSGSEKTKSWGYSMTDRMLESLIDLCFVDAGGNRLFGSLDLEDLLKRMKDRFGILINEVPPEEENIESGIAANLNLQEFKTRLRQLGRFESLSDEFEAQYVKSPFRRNK
jgi:hypothetical protein